MLFKQSLYFAFLLQVFALEGRAVEPSRFALLIGNQTYSDAVGPLVNPHNDVDLVGRSLKKLKFQIATVKDGSYRQMDAAFKRHVDRVRRGGKGAISFIYYSGHGVANPETRVNYIIPVDVAEANDDLWFNAFEQQSLVDRLKRYVPNAIHYVVFDACRNELNITGPASKSLGTNKGFMPIANSAGILVAYATAPGKTASDRGTGGGEYAKALAEELLRPGLEAVTMFRRVQLRVARAINQEPWLNYGTLPEVYLAGRDRPEVVAWESIKDSNEIALFKNYLVEYPRSPFSESARFKIRILENERVNQAATAEWKLIETSSDTAVLKRYIARYPTHPYASFARFRIEELDKQAVQTKRQMAWEEVKNTKDLDLLRRFIRRHKDSLFARLAQERIALLNERRSNVATRLEQAASAWQRIQDLKGAEPLKDFIAAFGDTPFRSLAESRLNDLEQRQAKKAEASRITAAARERERREAEKAERQRLAALETAQEKLKTQTNAAQRNDALAQKQERLAALEAERKRLDAEEVARRRKAEDAKITLTNLTKSLQVELSRVGCNPGGVDGVWGSKSRLAISLFNQHAGSKLDTLSPTLIALETVRKHDKRVCPDKTVELAPSPNTKPEEKQEEQSRTNLQRSKRPNPVRYSRRFWPRLSSGDQRSVMTKYGRLSCIGGYGRAIPRRCKFH